MNERISRLHHVDLLRGLIIVFMVIDHAMVYCSGYAVNDPMDVPGTEPKIFLPRLISHFCAPLFVFMAGLSAALIESKFSSNREFSLSLIKRGAVLILLEFTIVSWSWSFNPTYPMLYAQVIWAIGCGFILLGLFRLLGLKSVLAFGLIVVFGHNLTDGVRFEDGTALHYVWSVLHQKNVLNLPGGFRIRTTYPILSIAGLMCLAYCAGRYYVSKNFSSSVEKKALYLGVLCLALYTTLRGFNLYGDTSEFSIHENFLLTLMDFLNPTKYPLSLQFMLLTVGIGLIALYYFKKLPADFSKGFLQTLGKASMFCYILHLYLLHLINWLLIPLLGYSFSDMTYGETLIGLPDGYGLTFIQTYILTFVVVIACVFAARHYMLWKAKNKQNIIAKYI